MNPPQHLRVVSSLFFVFILFFPGMAQASTLQKITRSLSDIPQSQIQRVVGVLEDLNIKPEETICK